MDLNENRVLKILDGDVCPATPESGNYDAASVGELRTDLKPLDIVQPEGPSFAIEGNLLSWQRWSMRVSMHPTDGLVLHQVAYDDGGERRSILYRAALSEMVVPYGDGTDAFHWRNAFDAGEYGMGRNMGSLTLGCDCLGEIRYLDTVVADDDGRPTLCRNVVCIHEEDYSILWKHLDLSTGSSEVRRSRRLVVSCIGTLGNYEYGFYWYFYQDGHMEFEIKLTGVVQTRAVPPGGSDDYGTIVATDLSAVNHQHIFNMRLDFDVDGASNSVVEVDTVPLPPGEANPHLNAFAGQETLLESEQQAQRTIDPLKARYWKIVNPSKLNRFGRPVAYKLLPEASSLMLAAPESRVAVRARFAQKHLWVTPYDPDEMHAAGDYPTRAPARTGCRAGPRRTAPSPAPTWSCGTPSGSRTSRAPRTGRSCRWSASASSCCPWDSSTGTRRWTCRPRRRPATTMPAATSEDGLVKWREFGPKQTERHVGNARGSARRRIRLENWTRQGGNRHGPSQS